MAKTIMGVQLNPRDEKVKGVQDALTKYGLYIKTRLGIHDLGNDQGLLIIEFTDGADQQIKELEETLLNIDNVTVKKMVF